MARDHQLDLDELHRVEIVVTRVVRARIRMAAEAEDLVQETLTRFLAERERAEIREPEHYAATIALNLVRGRWRRLAREGEVLPLLIDLREPSEPDDLAIDGEVSAALTEALAELDDERRRLLVEHEVVGRSTSELAEASTPGAVAASLARTRARLRVDVVVRYRRADLPSVACRPVLESISANDVRRQDRLGAAGHLQRCETCAELAEVIARRGIAWLSLAPVAALLRRRPAQAGTAAAVVAVAALAIASTSGGAPSDGRTTPSSASPVAIVDDVADLGATDPGDRGSDPSAPSPSAAGSAATPTPPDVDATDVDATDAATAERPAADASAPPVDPPPTDAPHATPPPSGERTAPVIELPMEIGPLGDQLVLDHPLLDPLEPVVCPVLDLPKPITGCSTDAPSDLPGLP